MIARTFRRTLYSVLLAAAGLLIGSPPVAAQTTVTQTTTSAAIALPVQGTPNTLIQITSATNIVVGNEIVVDQEAMLVTAQGVTTTNLTVQRGYDGTLAAAHVSGAIVYAGPASGVQGSPFVFSDPPIGNCTLTNELYSLRILVGSLGNPRANGTVWQCTGSATAAVWTNVVDSFAWIGPGNCWYSVVTGTVTAPTFGAVSSGTALGITTQISTVPAIPVIQVASTNAGVISVDTITCGVPIPSRVNASRGVYVVDATFAYGIIGTGGVNATQVAVEASGTMNGGLVFSQVAFPTPGAAETASTVAPTRWDTGTLVLTPAKAAFNSLVTTAGAFFTQKFTPATPMPMASDLTQYFVSLPVLCNTTQATAIYSSGILVHYRTVTGV